MEVLDEQDDVGAGVGSADVDVMEPAVDAQHQHSTLFRELRIVWEIEHANPD
ncbi:MAG: hypothetical protein ACXWDJ_01040 [Aeromicrobium sp.]